MLGGFQFRISLESSVSPNVVDWGPTFHQHAPDQQMAMANGGVFFAAHKRHAVLPAAYFQAFNAVKKKRGLSHPIVQHVTIGVEILLLVRTAPHFPAQKEVLDAGALQRGVKLFAVKMGHIFGIRMRACIHHNLNPVHVQKLEKLFQSVVGMAHRKNSGTIIRAHVMHPLPAHMVSNVTIAARKVLHSIV